MIVRCGTCFRVFDDAVLTTLCPHPPIGVTSEDYCRKHDLIRQYHSKLFEKLRCPAHEEDR